MTTDELRASAVPVSPVMGMLLGLPPGDPRIAEAVAKAGFGPVPERIEITASFCQCPACREARCEP